MYLMGIDLGTTNTKVAIYRLDGQAVGVHSVPTVVHSEDNGWTYYEPCEIWDNVCVGIRAVLGQVNDTDAVAAVSVCSAGEALIAIDAHGEPVGQCYPWTDVRTRQLGPWWQEHFTDKDVFRITGGWPQFNKGINHLLWVRRNRPEIFRQAKRWLHLADFITYMLSGEALTNYSIAGPSMMFDHARLCWSEAILAKADLDSATLTPLAPSSTPLGTVSTQAAEQTGLSRQTVVGLGGHDHITAALAANVVRPGDTLDSMGTGEHLVQVAEGRIGVEEAAATGVVQYWHVVPQRSYVAGSLVNGSGVLDWATERLGFDDDADRAWQLAAHAPPGSRGVFFLPHLRGCVTPSPDENSCGALVGLREQHDRGELLRAVCEGLAFELRAALASLEQLTGRQVQRVVGVGGGFRNPLLRQLKADVTARPFVLPQIDEAASLGAAMLGGLAAGVYASADEAAALIQHREDRVQPEPEVAAVYERLYQSVYRRLHEVLRPVHSAIHEAVSQSKADKKCCECVK